MVTIVIMILVLITVAGVVYFIIDVSGESGEAQKNITALGNVSVVNCKAWSLGFREMTVDECPICPESIRCEALENNINHTGVGDPCEPVTPANC